MKKIDQMTNAELVALQTALVDDPANRNTSGSFWLYNPKTRKKLDAIGRAITNNLAESRAAAGRPVPTCGYSGRQTNRRR